MLSITVMKATSSRQTRFIRLARGHGFTLIELLTVLAIIGVLAALTIAAIHNAHGRAKSARCQSNLRQLSIAMQSFVADNHVYPLYLNPRLRLGEYPEHSRAWVPALVPHGVSESILRCPNATVPRGVDASRDVSLAYNAYGLGADVIGNEGLGLGAIEQVIDPAFEYHPVPEALVIRPSGMLMLGDALVGWDHVVSDNSGVLWRNRTARRQVDRDPISAQRAAKRHGARANVSFCDGHVETLTFDRLFNDRRPEALALWNRDGQAHEERLE